MSVLPCSVRLNATRRPSGDTEGFARSECSGVAIEPRARPERSNHVSCVVTGPPKRYTTCPVFEAEKGLTWTDTAGRVYTLSLKELADWRGNRGDAGRLAPKGFPKSNKFDGGPKA